MAKNHKDNDATSLLSEKVVTCSYFTFLSKNDVKH